MQKWKSLAGHVLATYSNWQKKETDKWTELKIDVVNRNGVMLIYRRLIWRHAFRNSIHQTTSENTWKSFENTTPI